MWHRYKIKYRQNSEKQERKSKKNSEDYRTDPDLLERPVVLQCCANTHGDFVVGIFIVSIGQTPLRNVILSAPHHKYRKAYQAECRSKHPDAQGDKMNVLVGPARQKAGHPGGNQCSAHDYRPIYSMVQQKNSSNQSQGNKQKKMKERRPGSCGIVLLLLEVAVDVRNCAVERNGAERSIRRSRTANAQRGPFGSPVEHRLFIVVSDLYVVRHCVDRSFFAGASPLVIATKKFCTRTSFSNSVVNL